MHLKVGKAVRMGKRVGEEFIDKKKKREEDCERREKEEEGFREVSRGGGHRLPIEKRMISPLNQQ